MITMILISLGAVVGANLRYALSLWAAQQWGVAFPYGTLLVNVLGSFCIGILLECIGTYPGLVQWRAPLVTGLLGSLTTFSTFSFETYQLAMQGHWLWAGLNVVGSISLGLGAVVLGVGCVRLIV
ncbi:MAG: fluoride efflux transporter CrcB [Chloroflexi bacterium AL-W]|nr:fluoride efflux transporter CrcB [Chloroflexi bacterium AL-N1]NOK68661.1 fluoride efflux transporter CrcB [Chloroflexi bacterium AL-N10]NOK76147.1 fluoride efflux transporter CrcB [Chloroflexi bacterium AL-N5]NOK84216.1 fluoride efflux transporter CrcB [Chloroflexi bacterium AL-W]NOK91285.1 fluoride efflux transporter CrcB [Chloroflexi bacterium AL-N15]